MNKYCTECGSRIWYCNKCGMLDSCFKCDPHGHRCLTHESPRKYCHRCGMRLSKDEYCAFTGEKILNFHSCGIWTLDHPGIGAMGGDRIIGLLFFRTVSGCGFSTLYKRSDEIPLCP